MHHFTYHYGVVIALLLLLVACDANRPTVQESPLAMATTTHSPTYLTAEAEYHILLTEQALTPSPPQPTATPSTIAVTIPSPHDPELRIYEGSSVYQVNPRFQVTFAAPTWQLHETVLHHQAFADCQLNLYAEAMGMTGPMHESQITLANIQWMVRAFPSGGLISYYGKTESLAAYLFGITYSPDTDEDQINACQAAGEAVIATLTTIDAEG